MISSTGGQHGIPGHGKVQVHLQVEASTGPAGQGDGQAPTTPSPGTPSLTPAPRCGGQLCDTVQRET